MFTQLLRNIIKRDFFNLMGSGFVVIPAEKKKLAVMFRLYAIGNFGKIEIEELNHVRAKDLTHFVHEWNSPLQMITRDLKSID